jgi:hypothetical protein
MTSHGTRQAAPIIRYDLGLHKEMPSPLGRPIIRGSVQKQENIMLAVRLPFTTYLSEKDRKELEE